MSALDDIIAQGNAPAQPSALDAIIAQGAQAQAPQAQPQTGLQALPPQTPQQPAGPQPGYLASLGAGLGHGVQGAVLGAQQLLGHGASAVGMNNVGDWLTKDANQGLQKGDADYAPYSAANPMTAGAGNLAGNIAATAPLAMVAPEAAGAGVMGKLGLGAAVGAANGAVTPVDPNSQDFAGSKLGQLGTGAAFGAGGAALAGALGKMVSGATGPAQQQLAQSGVTMTPGQILGGAAARTEDKLTSVPILGDMIKNAQQRAADSFNTATYNQVLAPLGQKYSGPIGNDGVAAVKQTISDAYDSALSRMTFKATDPAFQSDITGLASMAQNLPPQQAQQFKNIFQTQVMGKLGPQGNMDGQTLKGAQSELSRIASGYAGDPNYDNRQLGAAVGEIKNAIDNSLPRYNPPDAVQQLSNANSAYANFVRLRSAAGSQGAMNNGGVFTAAQLNSAVRANDKSVGKGASATGNALMQDFSGAGQQVLGAKYPNSGTPGRAAIMGALSALGGGGAAMAGYGPQALAGAGVGALASLPYTKMGQRAAQALLMSRPAGAQAIGQGIGNSVSPFAAALGSALANSPQR